MLQKSYHMITKHKNKIILGFFLVAVFFLRIFYITKVKGPFVYTDEMGYWGHAANLTGNIWSGVMRNMPWYAFGYSLLLVPLFLMSTDIVVMYKMAVMLNIILGLLSFWLAYKVIRKVEPEISGVLPAGVIAFTATSYSAYIFQSYIAWGETLLTFLVWLILYELISLEEKPGYIKSILLGATAGYAYMVHNRMLAVAAAVLLTTVFLVWSKKIKVQHFLSVMLALMALFLLYSMGKNYLEDLLANNTVLQNVGANISLGKANTFSDQIGKVKEILTMDGMKNFFLNVVGQVWQILSATYLLAGFGIAFCINKGIKAIREKKNISFFLFPFMALAATIAMTSLFFIESSTVSTDGAVRIDTFFYGRYNDILMGVFIMMALLFFYLKEEKKAYYIYSVPVYAIYLTVSFVIYYNLKDINSVYLNTVSAVSTYMFHWLGEFAVWKCALITLCVSVLWLIFTLIKMPKQINRYIVVSLLLIFFFSTTALKCMRLVIGGENDYIQQYAEAFDFLNENTGKRDVVYTTMSGKPAYDLQTRVVDKAVISIDKCQVDSVTGSHYIVIPEQDYSDYDGAEYTMCLHVKDYVIIQREVQ